MNYLITTVAVCFAISVSAAALQEQQPTQKQTPPDALTGCPVRAVPTVFIFENARRIKSITEKGATCRGRRVRGSTSHAPEP
jgi:hypothetical protein